MHDARKCVGMYKRSFTASGRMVGASESVRKICVAASTAKRISPGPISFESQGAKGSQAQNDVSQDNRKTRGFIRGARDDCAIGATIMRNNEMPSPTLINQSRDASLKCSWAATDNLLMHHIGEPCNAAASWPLLLPKSPIKIQKCCPLGLVTRFTPVIWSFLTRKEAWDLGLTTGLAQKFSENVLTKEATVGKRRHSTEYSVLLTPTTTTDYYLRKRVIGQLSPF